MPLNELRLVTNASYSPCSASMKKWGECARALPCSQSHGIPTVKPNVSAHLRLNIGSVRGGHVESYDDMTIGNVLQFFERTQRHNDVVFAKTKFSHHFFLETRHVRVEWHRCSTVSYLLASVHRLDVFTGRQLVRGLHRRISDEKVGPNERIFVAEPFGSVFEECIQDSCFLLAVDED